MNIMGRLVMRPPILLVRSCIYLFIIFLGSLSFLSRGFFCCLLGDPLGEASLGFHFSMAFIFYQLLLPPGPLTPSSHKTRCTPDGHPNGQTRGMGWMSGFLRCKNDNMRGADDGSANPLWWLTKTHEYQLAKLPHQLPQQWSSGLV
jgi:hypothetical protein